MQSFFVVRNEKQEEKRTGNRNDISIIFGRATRRQNATFGVSPKMPGVRLEFGFPTPKMQGVRLEFGFPTPKMHGVRLELLQTCRFLLFLL